MLLIELLESWDISSGHSARLDDTSPGGVARSDEGKGYGVLDLRGIFQFQRSFAKF
jgi:hypothetical protein